MFADSFLDVPWSERSRRGYATMISFTLEAFVVIALLLSPLLYVHGLPRAQWMAAVVAPPPTPPSAPSSERPHPRQTASNFNVAGQVVIPRNLPDQVLPIVDQLDPAPVDASQLGVHGGTGDRMARNGVFGSTGTGLNVVVPPPVAPTVTEHLRVSQMMEGNLVHRVQPDYPSLARQARIQGLVVLHALISRDGKIENLQVISGHPMLVQAAIGAVRQSRYRPYVLNGEPVEVETQITVNFTLAGG
jgi:periplasmic protein TonB